MSKLHSSYTTVKSRLNAKFRYLFLAVIAIGIGFAMTGLTKTVTPVTAANNIKVRQAPAVTHKLVASYYSLKENLNATLMLSNQGLAQLSVRIHLFSKSGAKLDLPAITLSGNEVRAMDLRQSIPAGSAFEEGSLEVNYEGRPLELGGVVALMNPAQSLMFEEELVEPARAADSTRLEGVWWRPTATTEVHLAVSNNSNAAVSVTVQTQGEGQGNSNSKTVTLASHATRVLTTEDHNGNDELPLNGTTGGISINYTGAPGVVVAHGLIQEPSKGFSNVIDFTDPQKSKLTRLDGTGLRFGAVAGQQLNQIVVLRNISNAAVTVSGRIPYTLSNGTKAITTIQNFQLASGDVKKVNLPSIASADQITAAGLEFNFTGNIGSVIGSALSYSNDRNQVFRVPLRDAQVQSSSTGTYPWSISDNSSTMVYLKNVTDTVKKFVLVVRFTGGNYVLNEQTITAWQSVAFDLRSLRDNQIPDGNGNVIPMNITNGQAHWSALGASKSMIGRAEQPDTVNAMSMTSACGIWCTDSFVSTWMIPGTINGFVGDTTQLTSFREMVDSLGNHYTQQYGGSLSSDNPSVATTNPISWVATGVGAGSTYLDSAFTAYTYTDEGSYCSEYAFTAVATASITVQPITITFQKADGTALPTPLRVGITANGHDRKQALKAIVQPANQAPSITLAINNKLQLSDISISGSTINFKVVGVTKSSSPGDSTITAKKGTNILRTQAVSVVVPDKIAIPHDLTGGALIVENRGLNTLSSPSDLDIPFSQVRLYSTYLRYLTITVWDQFGDTIGALYRDLKFLNMAQFLLIKF